MKHYNNIIPLLLTPSGYAITTVIGIACLTYLVNKLVGLLTEPSSLQMSQAEVCFVRNTYKSPFLVAADPKAESIVSIPSGKVQNLRKKSVSFAKKPLAIMSIIPEEAPLNSFADPEQEHIDDSQRRLNGQ